MASQDSVHDRRNRRRRLRTLAVLGLGLVLAPSAHAQGIDHAQLQDMFGEPVTTSVTGKPQRASEAAAALVIITREDIRRSPARDIPGLLHAYAGIDVARWTAGKADVAIRGGVRVMNPNLLVLVNGRQVYLDHYGFTNWGGIGVQLDEIQQIEVVKGPNSALFGFNAVSGVVNIITIDPLRTQHVSVRAGAGTEGQAALSGVAAVRLNESLGLRLSAGYETFEELGGIDDSPLSPTVAATRFDPEHREVAGELYARLGEATEGSLSLSRATSRKLEVNPVLFTAPAHYGFTSLGGRLSHDTGWGVLSVRASHNWSNVRARPNTGDLIFRNKVLVAAADTLIRAGSANTLRFAIEYRANRLKMDPGYAGATRYNVYAASGMWESRISPAITWTVAGRVDHFRLSQDGIDQPTIFTAEDFDRRLTEWSLNSALLIALGDTDTLRLSVNRGSQAPSLFALGSRLTFPIPGRPFPAVASGDPAINPSRIWSAEIGLTHRLDPIGGRVSVTAFFSRTSNLISNSATNAPPRAAPPAYPFILKSAANVGRYKAYGLEAEIAGRLSRSLSWMANYSWTRSQEHIDGQGGGHFMWPLAPEDATPEHKVKAQISYEQGPWTATLAGRYTSATRQLVVLPPPIGPLTPIKVDDSLALDAKIAVKVGPNLTFTIVGENLTDAASAYLSPAPAERRVRAGLEVSF